MKALPSTAFLLLVCTLHYSQPFFNIIPDLGGDDMEGRIYNVIPLENDIKIIGLIHDSIVPGFIGGTWPILATFSYDGMLLNSSLLIDSMYSDGFYYFTRRIEFKNDSICYLYDRRNLGNPKLDAYLIELNYNTGKILRSKIIFDNISNHSDFVAQDIYLGNNGNIYLINSTNQGGPHPQILTVLDSNFNITFQGFVSNFGRDNFTKYIEEDLNGNLILVGTSRGAPNSVWFESKLFRQVLDGNFNSIDFRLAPTNEDHSIVLADSYPVIKSSNGNWVIATQQVVEIPNCQDCSLRIPYVVNVTEDFSKVNWETRMFDGDINSSEPVYYINAITEVNDGFIFVGSKDGSFGPETSGLLGKVSLSGDSLWLKNYMPIGWDTFQSRWFLWQDIKTTSLGNIVIGGHGSDSYSSKISPWLLHLNSDGCLDPGCNISSQLDPNDNNEIDLEIYPNPSSSQCNIRVLENHHSLKDITLRIINNEGQILKDIPITWSDTNFNLNLESLNSGYYFIQVINQRIPIVTKIISVIKK